MMRTFVRDWAGALRDGWRVARAIPLLVVAMAAIELAQHAVELRLGFFSPDMETHRAASEQPLRMAFGWPKMLTLYAVAFIATRWFVTRDAHAALRPSHAACRRYALVVLFQLVPAAAIIHAGAILAPFSAGEDTVRTFRAVCGGTQLLLEPALLLWFVAAAKGDDRYGPVTSARATGWLYLWAFPLLLAVRVPPSLLHAKLNLWAAGRPPAAQWAMLAVDALVVATIAVVIPAAQVRIARHIAARRGRTPAPVPPPPRPTGRSPAPPPPSR